MLAKFILQAQNYQKFDITAPAGYLGFSEHEELDLSLHTDGHTYDATLTPHAMSQLLLKLGSRWKNGCPQQFVLGLPSEIRVPTLEFLRDNYAISNRKKQDLFFRSVNPTETALNVRAVFTDRYEVVDNDEILPILDDVLEDTTNETLFGLEKRPLVLEGSYVDQDQMSIRVMVETPDQPQYGAGFIVKSSEIGGSIMVLPFIQRRSCQNSTVFGEASFRKRHIGDASFIRESLTNAIQDAFSKMPVYLKKIKKAETEEIPLFTEYAASLFKDAKLPDYAEADFWDGTENEKTLMGVVNGFTHAAKTLQPEQRLAMEIFAGGLL